MMNTELNSQYSHIWRVFERLVNDFDDAAWIHTGRKATTPARLSFHILKATKYYLQDISAVEFASGKSFETNCETASEEVLPSRSDVIICIKEFAKKTENWIADMDLNCINQAFEWAGKTKLGVVIFLLKHSVYHLGELSSLLNESKNGEAEDNYVKAL
ncbi:MAG TPA: hypothetical protein VLE49_12960 [Anaerolineales bacterium]|nr:hypothetical protein [Anaerolineales bacterium]